MKNFLIIPLLCFIIGVFICGVFVISDSEKICDYLVIVFLAALIFLSLFFKKNKLFYVFFCFLFLVFGCIRTCFLNSGAEQLIERELFGRDVGIYGEVVSVPIEMKGKFSNYIRFDFIAEEIQEKDSSGDSAAVFQEIRSHPENKMRSLKILINYYGNKDISVGDKIITCGRIIDVHKNRITGFDYSEYLNRKGYAGFVNISEKDMFIRMEPSPCGKNLYIKISEFRKISLTKLKKYFKKGEGGMFFATVLGDRRKIRDRDMTTFAKTGTLHIFAISGLHVGIFVFGVVSLFNFMRVEKRAQLIIVICSLIWFCIFTGMSPSTIRATCMTVLFMIARNFNRKPETFFVLIFSAAIILFIRPGDMFHPGFVLSFAAVGSIFYIFPLLKEEINISESGVSGSKNFIYNGFIISSSILIGTAPFVAYFFKIFTPVSILSNFIAVSGLVVLLFFGFGLLVCSFLEILIFGNFFVLCIVWTEKVMVHLLQGLEKIPFSCFKFSEFTGKQVFIYYMVLVFSVFLVKHKKKRKILIFLPIFIGINLVLFNENCVNFQENSMITFPNVGRSDSAIFETNQGHVILIDASTSEKYSKNIIESYLRKRAIRKIDCIIITHPHEDHMAGVLSIIKNFDVEMVIENVFVKNYENMNECKMYKEINGEFNKKKIKRIYAKSGDALKIGEKALVLFYNPELQRNINDDSLVIKIFSEGNGSAIFTGDVCEKKFIELLDKYKDLHKCDVLKFPHHGIGYTNLIFEMISSEYIIIPNNLDGRLKKFINSIKSKSGIYVTGVTDYHQFEEINGKFEMVK